MPPQPFPGTADALLSIFSLSSQHWAIRTTFHANHSGYSTASTLSFPTCTLFTLSTCPAALPEGVRPLMGSQSVPGVSISPGSALSSRPRWHCWAGAAGWRTQTWTGSPSPPKPSPCSPLWKEKHHEKHPEKHPEKHHEKHPPLWFSRNKETLRWPCALWG